MNYKNKVIMDVIIIGNKIRRSDISDSEIIQETESAKEKEIPGFNINLGSGTSGWSSLMLAVDYDRKDLVRYLLSYPNINVNHRSIYNSTALHYCDQVSVLKLLLGYRDIDVNIQNDRGQTGLHRVCRWGREACVKEYLLDTRGDALIRNKDGDTGRDIALRNGYPRIAKIIGNSRRTSLLRIPDNALLYDIVRMIIEEYI